MAYCKTTLRVVRLLSALLQSNLTVVYQQLVPIEVQKFCFKKKTQARAKLLNLEEGFIFEFRHIFIHFRSLVTHIRVHSTLPISPRYSHTIPAGTITWRAGISFRLYSQRLEEAL